MNEITATPAAAQPPAGCGARSLAIARTGARCFFVAPALALLAGCAGERTQSALHPAGPMAADIARVWWILFAVCTAVFVVVVLLMLLAVLRRGGHDRFRSPLGDKFIVVSGIIIPTFILAPLLFLSLGTTSNLRMPETSVTIEVVGYQWWWEVRYPDFGIVTANELHIPVGEPVRLEMTSADVVHSFWVPELGGKRDLNPGITTTFWIQADRPGVFRGQCAEYCGVQHAKMGFLVVALPVNDFATWVSERQEPHPEPVDERLLRGREAFFTGQCHACHAIRDTGATARVGPDLTHIGSRLSLGAATVPNNRGNLMGWIANPQPIKPGNLMPPTYLETDELHDLTDYLMSLQ